MKVLILGVNGFIGHTLARRILATTPWEVRGMDLACDRLEEHLLSPSFHFSPGDICRERAWVDRQVTQCDVVLPLAAMATPASYVRAPLDVFRLDFEENLRIVRLCVEKGKRLIFPSTSEVYGMCPDDLFHEETSPLVLGPIAKQRWIYACAKQMLDRVIWAYGGEGLSFTLFRPFNWIGPNLDSIDRPAPGSSRVVTQFLGHLLRGEPIQLVDGGRQRRCFTDVEDGVDGLMRILGNPGEKTERRIFNLGNPDNDCSIHELALLLIDVLAELPGYEGIHASAVLEHAESQEYYGDGYQDLAHRKPDIAAARTALGWEPQVPLREALRRIVAFYLRRAEKASAAPPVETVESLAMEAPASLAAP